MCISYIISGTMFELSSDMYNMFGGWQAVAVTDTLTAQYAEAAVYGCCAVAILTDSGNTGQIHLQFYTGS